ncbi:MAG: hypothetical protein ABIP90_12305 [Vicinamibacterales bacterium]
MDASIPCGRCAHVLLCCCAEFTLCYLRVEGSKYLYKEVLAVLTTPTPVT